MDHHIQRLQAMGWKYAPYEFKKIATDEAQ